MSYRRFHRTGNTRPREMRLRYAGTCHCCGEMLPEGSWALYVPASDGRAAYVQHADVRGDMNPACFARLKREGEQRAVNGYAGDGLDMAYEDQCRDMCGL